MRRLQESHDWPESWRLSHHYDGLELYGDDPRSGYAYSYRARRAHTLECIQRFVPRGARVLDVAAGQGNFTLPLAESGYDVTWNDLRIDLADYVKAKHERGSVHFLPGNVLDLGVEHKFDAVLVAEVIEHVARPDRFLQKISELVKPSGWVILTTPNGRYIRNPLPRFSDCKDPDRYEAVQFRPDGDGHIFALYDDEVATLSARAGLELRYLRHFGNPLTSGHLKLSRLLRMIPRPMVERLEDFTLKLPESVEAWLHAGTVAALQKR